MSGPERGSVSAAAVGAAAGAAAGAALLALAWALLFREPLGGLSLDLYPTWVAAQLHAAGVDEAVYHPALWIAGDEHPAWAAVIKQAQIKGGNGTSYTYGPLYLMVLTPLLARITLEQTSVLLFAINAASVGLVGLEIARLARLRSAPGVFLLTVGLGLAFPVLTAVWFGQNTLPCLAAALLGERFLGRGDRLGLGLGALLWTAAAAMKPWFVLALPLLALQRRWRALGAAVGAGVTALVAIPALFASPALLSGYAAVSARLLEITVIPRNNVSIRAHLTRLGWSEWPRLALNWSPVDVPAEIRIVEAAICTMAALIGIAWVLRRRPHAEWVLAVGLVAVLLPLGVVWTHYLSFALPLVGLALLHPEAPRSVRAVGLAAALYLWVAMPTPLHLVLRTDPDTETYLAATREHTLASAWRMELPMLVVLGLAAVVIARVRARGA